MSFCLDPLIYCLQSFLLLLYYVYATSVTVICTPDIENYSYIYIVATTTANTTDDATTTANHSC